MISGNGLVSDSTPESYRALILMFNGLSLSSLPHFAVNPGSLDTEEISLAFSRSLLLSFFLCFAYSRKQLLINDSSAGGKRK